MHTSPEADRVLLRRDRERLQDVSEDEEQLAPDIQQFENLHREVTKIRNIDQITISGYTIKAWYYSPYPRPFHDTPHLFICDHCFHYYATQEKLDQHLLDTNESRPPGREIYRTDTISIFELHGKRQKVACQCLCLLAKLFLDHKTLFYDVENFAFYVLCECDDKGAHFAAYFSRELYSEEGNILACIVALPPYQKKGYGRLLISLSYEIAKRQHRSGGPERPLSDLGRIAFHAYWRNTLIELLKNFGKDIQTLDDLVRLTSISRDDIIDVLREMNCVSKGKGEYELMVQKESLANAIAQFDSGKPKSKIDPMALIWMDGDDEKTSFAEGSERPQ
jgi:histone acetyltransferase MYST1